MIILKPEQMNELIKNPSNIRNITVISAGILVDNGRRCVKNDCRCELDSIYRENCVKCTNIPLIYEAENEILPDLQEAIDGPKIFFNVTDVKSLSQYPDFNVVDGAVVVVDCIEGVCVETESILRKVLVKRVKPVLVINKLDRALLELQLTKEEMYKSFVRIIEAFNAVIREFDDGSMGNCQVSPEKGNVAFACGFHGWAFTLRQLARKNAASLGLDRNELMDKLWGDNYYNPSTKEWSKKSIASDGTELERGFCHFALDPIFRFRDSVLNERPDEYHALITKYGVPNNTNVFEVTGKPLLKSLLRRFMPAYDAILEMASIHLPSPNTAQSYRCEILYDGPSDDECFKAIKNCDPNGPLMVYVSKMIPASPNGNFYAFARVFSGTIKAGMKVRVQGPKYQPGSNVDLFEAEIPQLALLEGSRSDFVESVQAGNIIGLVGIHQLLWMSGTVTSSATAHNFKSPKCHMTPVLQVSIEPANPEDRPRLLKILAEVKLNQSDFIVNECADDQIFVYCISGGVNSLQALLKGLERSCFDCPIRISEPFTSYRETITAKSSQIALAKSPNCYHRIYMKAEPLSSELCKDIEEGKIGINIDPEDRARLLVEKHNWDPVEASNIWRLDSEYPNIYVGIANPIMNNYPDELKDFVCEGFKNASTHGALTGEPLHGIKFQLADVTLHVAFDKRSFNRGQIFPTAINCAWAAQYLSKPALMEPIYLVEIICPESAINDLSSCLNRRRGQIVSQQLRQGSSLLLVKAHLPVERSIDFASDLRLSTRGKAFLDECYFDHWKIVPGDVFDPNSEAHKLARSIRKRKGLSEDLPPLDRYLDRI